MHRNENLTVLRRLRDGRDPDTGEPLPADHPFQRVDVVRALFAAVDAMERGTARAAVTTGADPAAPDEAAPPSRPRRPAAPNAGKPWSEEDDRRLVEAFDGGADERELCDAFGRSRTSIRSRLIRLGRGALLGDGPAPRYPVLAPVAESEGDAAGDDADPDDDGASEDEEDGGDDDEDGGDDEEGDLVGAVGFAHGGDGTASRVTDRDVTQELVEL